MFLPVDCPFTARAKVRLLVVCFADFAFYPVFAEGDLLFPAVFLCVVCWPLLDFDFSVYRVGPYMLGEPSECPVRSYTHASELLSSALDRNLAQIICSISRRRSLRYWDLKQSAPLMPLPRQTWSCSTSGSRR